MKIQYKDGWVYDGPKQYKPQFLGVNTSGKKINEYLSKHKKDFAQYWRKPPKKKPTQKDGYYVGSYGDQPYTTSDTCDGSRAYEDQTTYTPSRLDFLLHRR